MSQSPAKKSWLDYLITFFQILSTILLTFSAQTFSDEGTKFIGIPENHPFWGLTKVLSVIGMGIGLFILSATTYLSYKQSQKIVELNELVTTLKSDKLTLESALLESETKREAIEYGILKDFYAFSTTLCMIMAKELEFGSQNGVYERISFYVFDSKANCFYLLSRYSENTALNTSGELAYQPNIGNIGKVWENIFWYANNYPSSDTKRNKEKYIKRAMKDGLTKEEVIDLRMKAQLYAGLRISDSKRNPIAIVMLEATSPLRWDEPFLREYFEQESHRLTNLFEIIHPKTPEISSARKKGF